MAADRPNVIFILSDDQGPWAAGCYGNPEIRTPNIDRIASTGARFENYFVSSPVCSPSRAAMLTGRISSQHGVHDFLRAGNTPPNAISYLEDEICYTDVLAEHGWTCGLSGKWHLGNSTLPQHGFTHWFTHQTGGGRYNDAPMVRNGELVDEPGYITTAITEEALGFIDEHAGDDNPFYLSVHYTAPHAPWDGHPQDIVDSYDDCAFESCPSEERHPWACEDRNGGLTKLMESPREPLKGYFAAVTAMDLDIGRILDHIEANGLRDDTLVIFTSDNGFSCGHHGFWGKGNGTEPTNMYEQSVKVPFVASHPGVIPAGTVQSGMVSAYDILPTLLDYLDLPLPEGRNLPGRSFVPALKGEDDAGRESVVIFDEYGPTRMIRTSEAKYVHRYPDGPNEFYDLANDPEERANLVEEPAAASRVTDLRSRLEGWFEEYADPDKDGLKYPISGNGQLRRVGAAWDDQGEVFPTQRYD